MYQDFGFYNTMELKKNMPITEKLEKIITPHIERRIYYGVSYFLVLIWNIITSTFDVFFKIITGEIEPTICEIETKLERPVSQTILANSITLTPGTLTVDLDSEKQLLTVAVLTPRDTADVIPFEKYIKRMLE